MTLSLWKKSITVCVSVGTFTSIIAQRRKLCRAYEHAQIEFLILGEPEPRDSDKSA